MTAVERDAFAAIAYWEGIGDSPLDAVTYWDLVEWGLGQLMVRPLPRS